MRRKIINRILSDEQYCLTLIAHLNVCKYPNKNIYEFYHKKASTTKFLIKISVHSTYLEILIFVKCTDQTLRATSYRNIAHKYRNIRRFLKLI